MTKWVVVKIKQPAKYGLFVISKYTNLKIQQYANYQIDFVTYLKSGILTF